MRSQSSGFLLACLALAACAPEPAPPPPIPIPLACEGVLKQGGLALCRTAPGAAIAGDGKPQARADDTGLAVIGLARDQAARLTLVAEPAPEPPAQLPKPAPFPLNLFVKPPPPPPPAKAPSKPLVLEIASRQDEVRRVTNVACDRIAPRDAAAEAQVAADRAAKDAAWPRWHPPLAAIRFASPSDGPFTSPYGAVRDYISPGCPPYQSVHWGLDIGTPSGWPVRAPMAGTVLLARPDMFYEGNAVYIDHGRGLVSGLFHMSRIDVKDGDRLEAGQQVGLSGATGRVNGAHVHWAIRWRNALAPDRSGDLLLDPKLLLEIGAPAQAAPAGGG